jgi:hypothetical protein
MRDLQHCRELLEDEMISRVAPLASLVAVGALLIGFGSAMADDRTYYGRHMDPSGRHMGEGPGGQMPAPGMMRPGYGQGSEMMGPGTGYGMYGRGGSVRRGSMAIDGNDDGVVSQSEGARHFESVFTIMDRDEDGSLTEEEFLSNQFGRQHRTQMRSNDVDAWKQRKAARFKDIDADKDGEISQAEFLAHGKDRFESADSDKNGTVTVWEFRARRRF